MKKKIIALLVITTISIGLIGLGACNDSSTDSDENSYTEEIVPDGEEDSSTDESGGETSEDGTSGGDTSEENTGNDNTNGDNGENWSPVVPFD